MQYFLDLNPRPFEAIKTGIKNVEGRSPTKWDQTPFEKINPGDIIKFTKSETNENLTARVRFVHHYPNVKTMLEKEGVENVLSSYPKTIEHGIESYNAIHDYKESINKFGIYAIGLALL